MKTQSATICMHDILFGSMDKDEFVDEKAALLEYLTDIYTCISTTENQEKISLIGMLHFIRNSK